MDLVTKHPHQSLNDAFRKVKVTRAEFDPFRENLKRLLGEINDTESEEHHKNLVIEFLKDTWYGSDYYINTKGRTDLVIHTDEKSKSPVGVIIETKKPTNASEMITRDDINRKAFHELMLYYLRERIDQKNLEIKKIIATNTLEWFVFDANIFEKLFAKNKKLVKQFEQFEAGKLSGTDTTFFYNHIAKPFLNQLNADIPFTWFDLAQYGKLFESKREADERKLINLYKILSPEHLLKLPFANDSNKLNKGFYRELLHIIGLEDRSEGSKRVIARKKQGERDPGSLLENAITQIDALDKLSRLPNPRLFGANREERLFNVALELVITWVNRILFLKLLESQLKTYHDGDEHYLFLNKKRITDFDDLNSLFFLVLARKPEDRSDEVQEIFARVPYLNSSLFDPTELEHDALVISNLRDFKTIPIHNRTVLKDDNGKKRTGELDTLTYLFDFLDAYDFSSDTKEQIQEENKSLINASVLGLIFEKINGYRDGSYFTPGFITMYMCRETIRRAILEKFREVKGWEVDSLDELYGMLSDKEEANAIINSITICDPAVGSGHFLVSALNEIIAIKSDLKILLDRDGRVLRGYHIVVDNDELVIKDDNEELFEYHPKGKESQRIQEALFHEKQTIIENCLFGVDINTNSVKICRLRLWIELLKNAYYRPDGNLETLPNIDINIKAGNSLISRFDLDADLKSALKKSKWTVETYRNAVQNYREATSRDQKKEFLELIKEIKGDFETEISKNDPKVQKLNKRSGELYNLLNQQRMFDETKAEKKKRAKKQAKLEREIEQLTEEIEAITSNKIYENAFEWRFEFPEVLDDQGAFVGFDVVIGNPPYIRQEELKEIKPYLKENYEVYHGTADLYQYFTEKGLNLLDEGGVFHFIMPNKWIRANYGKSLRGWLQDRQVRQIIDFGDLPVFEEATTYPCLLEIQNRNNPGVFKALEVEELPVENIDRLMEEEGFQVDARKLSEDGWSLVPLEAQRLLDKLKAKGTPLGKYVDGHIYYGIKTGYNKAFVIDEETKERLIAEDASSEELIKPFLAGRDIKRYQVPEPENYLIFTRRGVDIDKYPAIKSYLEGFKEQLEPRPKDIPNKDWPGRKPGSYEWYEIQDAVDYYEEFEKPKIIFAEIATSGQFMIDDNNIYVDTTAFIMAESSKGLLGILNSTLWSYLFSLTSSEIRGGYLRWKKQYMNIMPLPESDFEIKRLESLVDQILAAKKADPSADTSKLEAEIDRLVYELYGLSEEEIGVVEESVG